MPTEYHLYLGGNANKKDLMQELSISLEAFIERTGIIERDSTTFALEEIVLSIDSVYEGIRLRYYKEYSIDARIRLGMRYEITKDYEVFEKSMTVILIHILAKTSWPLLLATPWEILLLRREKTIILNERFVDFPNFLREAISPLNPTHQRFGG